MQIKTLLPIDADWARVTAYAAACPWSAGPALARMMETGALTDWERVVAALDGDAVCGFCAVTKTDCIPNKPYTPYIGFVFVDEACRGHRISWQMIRHAMAYLKKLHFDTVYLVSDHENLYEKYGFTVVDHGMAPWGAQQKIYAHSL